ncbi:MAG TPA: hypothetical protein VK625_03285 [Flavitalea sp.]|nr:hypothetical protein [Flavitalea sp.]
MNRKYYSLLIFFLALSAVAVLFQNIFRMQLGAQFFSLDSFKWWFLVTSLTSLTISLLLLNYFHYRKYRIVFYTGIIVTIAYLCFSTVIFAMLMFQKLAGYYLPVISVHSTLYIVCAVSLIIVRRKEQGWLMMAGVFMLAGGLITLSSLIWSISSPTAQTRSMIENLTQWTSIIEILMSVAFIMHFIIEKKNIKRYNTNSRPQSGLINVTGTAGIISFIWSLALVISLTSESYSALYWNKQNFEKTKQLAELFEFRTFVNSRGETLMYRLLKPLNYDSTKRYPLVVSLPYGGQPGTDTIKQIEGAVAAEMLTTDINRNNYPAFVFIPHCPPGGGWGGIPNYPTTDSLVFDAISALDNEFAIDVKRRYVTGLSRGGFGTWNFICKRPDMFAAAIPVCGGGDPTVAARAVDVAVWAFHGEKDKNVPVSGSRDMINAMKKAGGHPKYTEYPNEGHNIWYTVSTTPDLLDWLFAQKRS